MFQNPVLEFGYHHYWGKCNFYISIYFKDILLQIITFNLSLFVNQNQNCQTGNRRDVQ